mmetsp:Transcript_10913/g.45464  ORF Transcript_10913/g.45464 Transcript_10913/m.45464 type:complete len:228 (+) Transcript_10913:643-1326(+)
MVHARVPLGGPAPVPVVPLVSPQDGIRRAKRLRRPRAANRSERRVARAPRRDAPRVVIHLRESPRGERAGRRTRGRSFWRVVLGTRVLLVVQNVQTRVPVRCRGPRGVVRRVGESGSKRGGFRLRRGQRGVVRSLVRDLVLPAVRGRRGDRRHRRLRRRLLLVWSIRGSQIFVVVVGDGDVLFVRGEVEDCALVDRLDRRRGRGRDDWRMKKEMRRRRRRRRRRGRG